MEGYELEIDEILLLLGNKEFRSKASEDEVDELIDKLIEKIGSSGNSPEVIMHVHFKDLDGSTFDMNIQELYQKCKREGKLDFFKTVIKKTFDSAVVEKVDVDRDKIEEIIRKLENGEELSSIEQSIIDNVISNSGQLNFEEKRDKFFVMLALLDISLGWQNFDSNLSVSDIIKFFISMLLAILRERYENLPDATKEKVMVESSYKMAEKIQEKIGPYIIEESDPILFCIALTSIMGIKLQKSKDILINPLERFEPIFEKYKGKALEEVLKALLMYSVIADPNDVPVRMLKGIEDFIDTMSELKGEIFKETDSQDENTEKEKNGLSDEEIRKMMKGK